MANNRNNITEMPYAKWLEQTLHDISSLPVKGIALLVSTENGDSYTNYYNVSMADKLIMAGLIQQDSTLDMLASNGIIQYEDEEDDSSEDESNGEEE